MKSCPRRGKWWSPHELHRLRGFQFKRLLVVGSRLDVEQHRYHSNIAPTAIVATLAAFEVRYDLPVVWCDTPEAAARQVESWVWWYAREIIKNASALVSAIEKAPVHIA
jgi:DNA excision repair protein ERCC-4